MKNTIYIDIHLSEVIYEVKQTTHIKNVTVDNEESFKTASNLQVDSETDQLTYRCVGNAYAELKSRLSEYVNEQGTTANNKLFDEDSNVSVVLYVPTNFNLAVKDSIAASMHQFMVATSIREWYTITSKDDAKDYRLTGDEAIKLIIANINKRLRQTRGTLPNYANDIKGGTFDAESNSLVFTNDLNKEIFRISLPTDGTVTNGYYDAQTGIVHFKNPSEEDVFTIDLSPLRNAAKDYSLQSIVIENGNIVFKFGNDKSDITVPISSIVTLPDMSQYYTKDEVDEMLGGFTPGGGVEQVQADWEQTDTTSKDYIKNKPTIPSVPSWAMHSTKPSYTPSEVGALPSDTPIPSKTSDLTNDSGFITAAALVGYEQKLQIVRNPSTTITADFGKYYRFGTVDSLVTITLPQVQDNNVYLLGFIVSITMSDAGLDISTQDSIMDVGLSNLEDGKTYELNFVWNGEYWAVTATELSTYNAE